MENVPEKFLDENGELNIIDLGNDTIQVNKNDYFFGPDLIR